MATELQLKNERRLQLRSLNLSPLVISSAKLDTSLKRHTSLLTRLRSSLHTSLAVTGILKDIEALSLEKYVEEAVGAVVEGLGKCKSGSEVTGAVEIISAFHRRFPILFTPAFTTLLLQNLRPGHSIAADKDIKEKEDQARIIRQRGLLRVLGELEGVGVVCKVGGGATGEVSWTVLRELLTADKESLALAAPLAIAFIKHLGHLYLPAILDSHEFPTLEQPAEKGEEEIVGREMKEKFRKLCVAFVEALTRKEGREHVELQRLDKRNHEAYIRSGEVFEDRSKSYEKSVKSWERGWSSVTQLSELLSLPAPILPSLVAAPSGLAVTNGQSKFNSGEDIGGPGSLWADEEDKKFYEELRELKGEVPGSVLGLKVEKEAVIEETAVEETITDEIMDDVNGDDEISPVDVVLPSDPLLLAGPAAKLTALFTRLNDASSRSMIDNIAIEFAFLNSKAARKRLVKFLGSVNRNRSDILPYYARLVGTLDPYMPNIGKELVTLLEEEFRYLQRKKNTDMAETRSKNLRFLSELTKFKITPTHSILHVFKVLLDDLTGPNVTNLCTALEGCGRFLLRSEATSEKMMGVLEIVKRKIKVDATLGVRQVTELENAYYQCDPPDRPLVVAKVRTPMQLYIRQLFYLTLTRNSVDKVLKLTRKLHWEDKSIVKKLHSAFTKVWKIKYSNVHLFAILLYDLGRYHPEFNVGVIDEVLENVRIGMEINSFKYNQQRVATVKYLGELYNYRVIESRVVFDTLWSLITFGHPEGRPHPQSPSAIDSPDDCFRIRLVCTLLDTCGSCFQRGMLKKKLDAYLGFFQMYILSKGTMPMDVDFMVADTFEQIRPKLIRHKTFLEAALAVDEIVAKNGPIDDDVDDGEGRVEVTEEGRLVDADHAEDGNISEGEAEDDDESDEEEDGDSDDTAQLDDEDEEEDESLSRPADPNAMTQEQEDEFTRELNKMISNTGPSASASASSTSALGSGTVIAKKGLLDVQVPFVKRIVRKVEEDDEEGVEKVETGMRFTLLTKKGKSQNLSLEIPLDSSIAIHTLAKRAEDKKEQQEMKRLVLDYDAREQENQKQILKDSMAKRGSQVRYTQPKVVPYVAPAHPTSFN